MQFLLRHIPVETCDKQQGGQESFTLDAVGYWPRKYSRLEFTEDIG